MASGRSHSIATLTAATCFTVTAIHSHDPALLLTAAGALLGLICQPDLDHDDGSISQHFVRSVSGIAERGWWYYWLLYRKRMSHRSFWSHFPLVGTVIRVAYLFWWAYLLGWSLPPAFLNGLVAVDGIHWLMDARMFRKIFTQEQESKRPPSGGLLVWGAEISVLLPVFCGTGRAVGVRRFCESG